MAYTRIIENLVLNDTLYLDGPEWDNTLVRNIVIENVAGDGIMLRDVENVRIENITIRNVSGDGIKLSTLGSTENVTIADSEITNIGEDGINAAQREKKGIDHTGLVIEGNTISITGLNGNKEGLRHGIYVQSTDFIIKDNHITASLDGNGISVRSSGEIFGNYVEGAHESGIAYFPDHASGASDKLVIKDNVIVDVGIGSERADINILRVPSGAINFVVSEIEIDNNTLTQVENDIFVNSDYSRIGTSVSITANQVLPENQAKAIVDEMSAITGEDSGNGSIPYSAPVEAFSDQNEVRLDLGIAASSRTDVSMSVNGREVGSHTASADTTLNVVSISKLGFSIFAADGSDRASIGVDAGRMGVLSNKDSAADAISGDEKLIFKLGKMPIEDVGRVSFGLVDTGDTETVQIELFNDSVSIFKGSYQDTSSIDVVPGATFDEVHLTSGSQSSFSVDWVELAAGDGKMIGTVETALSFVPTLGEGTRVVQEVESSVAGSFDVGNEAKFQSHFLEALSMRVNCYDSYGTQAFLDNGQLGAISKGDNTQTTGEISGTDELVFDFLNSAGLKDAVSISLDLAELTTDEEVNIEAFRDGEFIGEATYTGLSTIQFHSRESFDQIIVSAGSESSFLIEALNVVRMEAEFETLL